MHVLRRLSEVATALDSRVRPGFARAIALSYTVTSWGLKVWWCLYVQVLVTRSSHALVKHPEEAQESVVVAHRFRSQRVFRPIVVLGDL